MSGGGYTPQLRNAVFVPCTAARSNGAFNLHNILI
jgi:hypothetical protein